MDSFLVVHDMTDLCCCRCRLLGPGWSAEQRGTQTASAASRASGARRKLELDNVGTMVSSYSAWTTHVICNARENFKFEGLNSKTYLLLMEGL
jgi:hypothetical protein